MGRYSQLVTVNVEHQFFAFNAGPDLRFAPTPETAALIHRADMILRNTPSSLNVFFDEARLEALRLELRPSDVPASLTFKVSTTDQSFKNYTAPAVQRSDATLFFETDEGGSPAPNPSILLHCGDFVSEADFRTNTKIDDIPALWSPRDLVFRPDFIIRINLYEKDFADTAASPPGRTYAIRFEARRTIWKYYVLGNFKRETPGIMDVRNQTEFEFTGKVSLPGQRTALTYRSKTSIPLRDQHDVRFQLKDRNVSGGKVLIRRLPVASSNQFGKEVIDGRETIVSEIYINC